LTSSLDAERCKETIEQHSEPFCHPPSSFAFFFMHWDIKTVFTGKVKIKKTSSQKLSARTARYLARR
ncbi:MAG: hypothetical protein MJ188_08475, partial [Treponema sp.]|nr:hypothetical protein [Treponema sp.]